MRNDVLLAAVGGLALAALPGVGTWESPPAPRQTEFRWAGRLGAGQTLEIRGINGGVRVERATGNEAEVVAQKSGKRSDPADVEIAVVPSDRGVTICALYPPVDGRENECRPGGGGRNNSHDNDVKVEWTVRLPDGVELDASTVNGDVTVRDAGGTVHATTVNGDVDVTTKGAVEATTVNGSIRAAMGQADWKGKMSFTTVNGSITLEVPSAFNAVVSAETVNGAIETDFPITVQGRFGPRHMQGTIGTGGRDLELETVNGSIRLRRAS